MTEALGRAVGATGFVSGSTPSSHSRPALFVALAGGAPLAFACGPEGGLEDGEIDAARALGWTVCSLGPLALRTETVAAAVLGAVRVWSGL